MTSSSKLTYEMLDITVTKTTWHKFAAASNSKCTKVYFKSRFFDPPWSEQQGFDMYETQNLFKN